MNHLERMRAMVSGAPVDRTPIAAWAHVMNLEDRHAKDFAKSIIDYQNMHQFDIVKVMSNSFYLTEDMGNVMRPSRDYRDFAFFCAEKLAIQKPEDWDHLPMPDVKKGALAREIDAIARICDAFQGDTPVLPTIFCPVMWAAYLYMDIMTYIKLTNSADEDICPVLENYFIENEKYVRHGLETITEANIRYMEALTKLGVAGFFYSDPYIHDTWSSSDVFRSFVKQYDVACLEPTRSKTWFSFLHVCGRNHLAFDETLDYPIDGLNWDDAFPDNPSLKDVRAKTDKVLVGGLNRLTDLEGADREQIKRTIRERLHAAQAAAGGKLLFSGGCSWGDNATHRFGVWQEVMEEECK